MNLRSLALAVVAGLASFLVVGLAVTVVAERWIEFSLFVGLPAGLVAGAVAAAAVYLGLADDGPAERRRVATSVGLFGVGFLATLVVLALAGQGLVVATVVGVAVGLVAALVGYVRGSTASPGTTN